MKKRLYIIINSLICGGAEKSLVSFLNELDFNKFEVYLQMFNPTGDFMIFLNKNVNILDEFSFINFCNKSTKQQLTSFKIKYIFSRIKLSLSLQKNKRLNNKYHDSQVYWKSCKNCFEKRNEKYDIALAWGQGLPTYYVAEKINADMKLAWINVNYEKAGYLKKFDLTFYKDMDKIILVSKDLYKIFKEIYPEFENKMKIIYDINSFELVKKMSLEKSNIKKDHGLNLVTVGRLTIQKGYDIAIDAARILK